jgi:DNA (cytosine-5)-methyltransferase 1
MPGYVFVENVPGLDKKPGSPLAQFKLFLSENGYIYDDGVINAKNFGVPQNRRRYVLLATRLKNSISIPEPCKANIVTVKQAIGDKKLFPQIEAGYIDSTSFIHTAAKLTEINLKRIKRTSHNGGDRRAWQNDPELEVNCYKEHSGHYDVYSRMYWDLPSPTITTRFCSYSNGRYGHPEQNRAISLREGAVLQSFPLDYEFYSDSQNKIAKMIGNAVPPKLAMEVAKVFQSKTTNSNG